MKKDDPHKSTRERRKGMHQRRMERKQSEKGLAPEQRELGRLAETMDKGGALTHRDREMVDRMMRDTEDHGLTPDAVLLRAREYDLDQIASAAAAGKKLTRAERQRAHAAGADAVQAEDIVGEAQILPSPRSDFQPAGRHFSSRAQPETTLTIRAADYGDIDEKIRLRDSLRVFADNEFADNETIGPSRRAAELVANMVDTDIRSQERTERLRAAARIGQHGMH